MSNRQTESVEYLVERVKKALHLLGDTDIMYEDNDAHIRVYHRLGHANVYSIRRNGRPTWAIDLYSGTDYVPFHTEYVEKSR